jgi:hypothetical protein
LIEQRLDRSLRESVDQFARDLRAEGYEVTIDSSLTADTAPAGIRSALKTWYEETAAPHGAILVGEFAAPLFNESARAGDPYWHDHLVDLYYMDLDGAWVDDDRNGVFEKHRSYEGKWLGRLASRVTKEWLPSLDRRDPEIWVSRIRSGTLAPLGEEITLYQDYFQRNHAYRSGASQIPPRAFMVGGGGKGGVRLSSSGWGAQPQRLYPDAVVSECKPGASGVLREALADRRGWSLGVVGSVSGPRMHAFHFYEGGGFDRTLFGNRAGRQQITDYLDSEHGPWDVTSREIAALKPNVLVYHLLSSETGRHDQQSYLGGAYLFFGSGLAVIAGTQHSGTIGVPALYDELARGRPLGEAWRKALAWSLEHAGKSLELHWCERTQPWDPSVDAYKAVLLGDGTLRLPPATRATPST